MLASVDWRSTLHMGIPLGPLLVSHRQLPLASCRLSLHLAVWAVGLTCARYTFAQEPRPTAPVRKAVSEEVADATMADFVVAVVAPDAEAPWACGVG